MLESWTNHFFYQQCKTLFYIQDPWNPRWKTRVVGKLSRKNQAGSPVSTMHIQRKFVSIAQPIDTRKTGIIIKHTSLTSPSQMALTCHFAFCFRHWPQCTNSLMSPNLVALKTAGYVYPLERTYNCHLQPLQRYCQITLPHLLSAILTPMLPWPHTFPLSLFWAWKTVLRHPGYVL